MCPKCGIPTAPLTGGPVQRAQFACCGVDASPYEVAVADAKRLYAAGEYDEAESTFDEAAMLGLDEAVAEEERATCYLYRGLCLVELDDELDEAMECFANACEIVALGPRKTATGEPLPAPAPAPIVNADSVAVASTSAVASYIHGLLLRSEGRDESKAKALVDAAIQMAASAAIEDIASNVEEVTRSVGTKDYGKKHTYEQAYSRALQLRCFWEYCGAASLAAALMSYGQYSYAADACTMALGQMHAAKEGVILEIDLGMPQLLSHREEQRRHRITVACYRGRAQCMFHMSAWPQALDDFKETSRRVSSDPFVMYHMGLCHVKLGQWKDGKDALKKALRLDPRGNVVSVADIDKSMKLVNAELKKQEEAAMRAERELLASLESEGAKKGKGSKKAKKKQKQKEKARQEGLAATRIAAVARGRQGRKRAAVLRVERDQARAAARKRQKEEQKERENEKKRQSAEGKAEAVRIEKAVKLARQRVASGDEDQLDDYLCPLTLAQFVDPVMDSLGHTYERKAIEHWLETHTTSPKTNEELPNKMLKPDMVMRAVIDAINSMSSGGGNDALEPNVAAAALGDAAMGLRDDEPDPVDCPLCCEAFDETDKCFRPCPCNYKVCLYCFHHIKDQGDKKCPACRADYGEGEVIEPKKEKKKSKRGGGKSGNAQSARKAAAPAPAPAPAPRPAPKPKAKPAEPDAEMLESDMMLDPRTYRTKLCKRWQDGHCSYGASCWFAHGKDQLRQYNPNPVSNLKAGEPGAPPQQQGQAPPANSDWGGPPGESAGGGDSAEPAWMNYLGAPAPAAAASSRGGQRAGGRGGAARAGVGGRGAGGRGTSRAAGPAAASAAVAAAEQPAAAAKSPRQKQRKKKPEQPDASARPATAPPGVALPPGVAAVGDPQPPNGPGLGGFSSGMGILGAIGGGPSSGSASPVGGGSGGGEGGFQAPPTDQSWGAIGGGGLGSIGGGNQSSQNSGFNSAGFNGGSGANDGGGFFGGLPSNWDPASEPSLQEQAGNSANLDAAGQGWSSMLSSMPGTPPRESAQAQAPAAHNSAATETVDYMYAANPAVRRGGMGVGLRFDGQGQFARVKRSAGMTDQAVPAGVWAIQRRPGDGGVIIVTLTLKWVDREPEAMVSSDGGISFTSQARGTDGSSLTLRSSAVPSWFVSSPAPVQKRRPESNGQAFPPAAFAQQEAAAQKQAQAAQAAQKQAQEAQTQRQRQQELARQRQQAEQQRRREAEQRRQQAKDAAQRQQQLQQEQVEQQKRRNQNRIEPDQMPSPPKKPEQTPQQQAEAHKGQQWHAYLGWVDEKLTAKQLVKEERKARREKERQRKKDGVTGLQGFQPVFQKDLKKLGEAAGEKLAGEIAAVEQKQQKEEEEAQRKAAATNSAMRRFLAGLGLDGLYAATLEQQEFVDVELFAQCSEADFAELKVQPAHARKIREALPAFLGRNGKAVPTAASGFAPDPRVKQLLEIANVDVEKYFALFCKAEIDCDALRLMSAADMKDVGVAALGPRRKILHAIAGMPK